MHLIAEHKLGCSLYRSVYLCVCVWVCAVYICECVFSTLCSIMRNSNMMYSSIVFCSIALRQALSLKQTPTNSAILFDHLQALRLPSHLPPPPTVGWLVCDTIPGSLYNRFQIIPLHFQYQWSGHWAMSLTLTCFIKTYIWLSWKFPTGEVGWLPSRRNLCVSVS